MKPWWWTWRENKRSREEAEAKLKAVLDQGAEVKELTSKIKKSRPKTDDFLGQAVKKAFER